MYDHIGLKVGNLDASVRFYTAVLAPLGYVLCSRDEIGELTDAFNTMAGALKRRSTSPASYRSAHVRSAPVRS